MLLRQVPCVEGGALSRPLTCTWLERQDEYPRRRACGAAARCNERDAGLAQFPDRLRERDLEFDFSAPFYDSISDAMTHMDLLLPLLFCGLMCVYLLVVCMDTLVKDIKFKRVYTVSSVVNITLYAFLLLIYACIVLGVFFSYHFCVDMTHVLHFVHGLWPLSGQFVGDAPHASA